MANIEQRRKQEKTDMGYNSVTVRLDNIDTYFDALEKEILQPTFLSYSNISLMAVILASAGLWLKLNSMGKKGY